MNTVLNAGPENYHDISQHIAQTLKLHTGHIALVSHVDPDGDALGSCLGLMRALRALGKDAMCYASVPHYLQFLIHPDEISAPRSPLPENTLLCVLDVDNNDAIRTEGADTANFVGTVINIDHHGTNKRQNSIHLVDPSKAATAQMVKTVVDDLNIPWNADIATPILTGIITDTGSFRFASTTPEVLHNAAELVGHGADLVWINENLAQKPKYYYALLALVFQSMEYHLDGLLVTAVVSEQMLERTGAGWEDVESFVSTIRSAKGTELAVIFKDYGDKVKLSIRSRGKASAQNIAIACGGGGHFAAAGATIHASFDVAKAQCLTQAHQELLRVKMLA